MGKKKNPAQLNAIDIDDQMKTAVCVPAIRAAIEAWRAGGYKGATDTSRELLRYWFHSDHKTYDGLPFSYYAAQQEAVEALVYAYEVAKTRTRKALIQEFAHHSEGLRLPAYDEYARYCIKMATGSGKTKVMALAIAWQYLNAARENEEEYAKTFLILAPNVIVFERLFTDFHGGRIFSVDPIVPRTMQMFWDMGYYMRGDGERAHSDGVIYLTNIQQLYEREENAKSGEPDIMTAVLGQKPKPQPMESADFKERIARRDGLVMVLNDEAHHTHDEGNQWNKVIKTLHENRPLAMQLDFSATPRYSKGGLFAWTISDYPLKQAIIDNIVKRPVKGISKIEEAKSNIASVKYQGFLTAGVERWKEYRESLSPFNKKPVLFVMLNTTDEADEVGEWLRTKYPSEFAGDRTLVIHTNKVGEISKKDEEIARVAAKSVDEAGSPVNAIVSVLMLREGWDVQSVTVVVGLRPYTAKANILPEQTIGRGLRLMFRGFGNGYTERVDIIGNGAFIEFVDDLEKVEGFELDTFEVGKDKLQIVSIQPVEEKRAFDIGIPELTPSLVRKTSLAEEIASLDVMKFDTPVFPVKGEFKKGEKFIYEGRDLLTDEKLLEREYSVPTAQTAQEVIGYYARRIALDIKLPSQFAALAPKVKEFFEHKAFGTTVDLSDVAIVKAMSQNAVSFVVLREFEKALRSVIVTEATPELALPEKLLSSTAPFPYLSSKKLFQSGKCVFNYVACDNELEYAFGRFLDRAEDVDRFAKLHVSFGFSIEYPDTLSNIRNYYPDFIVGLNDGSHWVIETKGREDIEVSLKDDAARRWCENATQLTGTDWNYIKVPQKEFEQLHPASFEELMLGLI